MPVYSENKIISLNSALGSLQNGTMLSNVIFNTGLILEEDDTIIDSHISLINCQIPISFYNVTQYNNAFMVSWANAPFITYYITIGNYSSTNLITTLQTFLGNGITISFNAYTGKYTFLSSYVAVFEFSFQCFNPAYNVLGFQNYSTYSTVAYILTAPFPMNVLGIKRLSIKS